MDKMISQFTYNENTDRIGLDEGYEKLKQALAEVNRWEYEKIMDDLKDVPEVKVSEEYFEGVLQECLDVIERKENKTHGKKRNL